MTSRRSALPVLSTLSVSKPVSKSPLIVTLANARVTPNRLPNPENVGDFYRLRLTSTQARCRPAGCRHHKVMYQRITHACGHMQDHHIDGFAGQRERKVRWLATTQCRSCFVDQKRSERAAAASRDSAAVAHLELPALVGSERQVSWAGTIRAQRLAACMDSEMDVFSVHAASAVQDAKWWIDHRDLAAEELLRAVAQFAPASPKKMALEARPVPDQEPQHLEALSLADGYAVGSSSPLASAS